MPEEIEKEKKRGIDRFGRAFEQGDYTAVIALQQINIQLQNTLLEGLRNAAYDDEVTDFAFMVDAADLGRDRTIGALLELKQRLLQTGPIAELPTSSPQVSQTSARGYGQPSVQTQEPVSLPLQELPTPPIPTQRDRTWTREYSSSSDVGREEDTNTGADDSHSHTRRSRHSSLLGVFKHRRTNSGSNGHLESDSRRSSASPISLSFRESKQSDFRNDPSTSRSIDVENPNFAYQDGADKTWGSWHTQQTSRHTLSVPSHDSPQNSSSATYMMRTSSSTPSTGQQSAGSAATPNPNPENDYLGFCKGAVGVQNGDRKAMRKRKEFNEASSGHTVHFLACSNSKCAFSGHMNLDLIWTKVWNMKESRGIKFRWGFLAKSHVAQSKVKDHQFMYQCLFCVFLGHEAPVIHGTELYLDHCCQEHRGRVLGNVVLYKSGCVNDRVCDDSEEFDINLFPLSVDEQQHAALRKQSEVLSDDLLGAMPKRISAAQDSMFSNEPWNQGLSDFHHGGDYEISELP